MVDFVTAAAIAVLCFCVAFVYSNLGLGGGILYVPILLSLGVGDNHVVVPISLTLTIATAASSTITHHRRGFLDLDAAKLVAVGAVLGSFLGVVTNVFLFTRDSFVLFFAVVTLTFGVLMLRKREAAAGPDDDSKMSANRKLGASGAAVGSGFLSGSAGVGGGIVNVPILTLILGRNARTAIGTSSLVIIPVAATGFVLTLALNAATGLPGWDAEYLLIPVLFPIVLVGAYVGSTLGLTKLKTRAVTLLFISLLFVVAAKLILVDLLGVV